MKQSVCITLDDGRQHWRLPDWTFHREDGPAVLYPNGDCQWYFDGRLHREDGPAIEFRHPGISDMDLLPEPIIEWWYHGKRLPVVTQEEFERYIRIKAFW
jgi:hypothetical protein